MEGKIRLGFLAHGIYYGGANTSLYLMIKHLDPNKYELFLYTPSCRSDKMKSDFQRFCKSITIIPMEQIRNAATCLTTIKDFNRISKIQYNDFIKILIKDEIDILHVNTSVFPHILHQVKSGTSIKIVTHVRELIPYYDNGLVQQYMIKQIYDNSDAIICISDQEAIPFKGHTNLQIIPNPFDFSKIDSINPKLRSLYKISDNYILIGMLGQFSRYKGQRVFVETLAALKKMNLTVPFKFIMIGVVFNKPWKIIVKKILGKSDYGSEILEFIRKNKLEEDIFFIPYSYQVLGLLKDIDIVVRPALTCDPWGRDVIESMALRKPVVATGKSNFYIDDNLTGFLVENPESKLLADKIADLITNTIKRVEFGEFGFKKIEQMCNVQVFIKKLELCYLSLNLNRWVN